jgi:hypothetical protein
MNIGSYLAGNSIGVGIQQITIHNLLRGIYSLAVGILGFLLLNLLFFRQDKT